MRRPGRDLARLSKRLAALARRPRTAPLVSSLEDQVAAMLDALGAPYVRQHLLAGVAVDFLLPDHRLVIECQGTWYHGDPARYRRGELTGAQRRKRRQDAALQRLCRRAGLRWVEVWEEDLRRRPESIRQRLRSLLAGDPENTMAERICRHTTPEGLELAVHHGDLTAEAVDAIVNAANGHLSHGGGVAGAIVRRGGQVIQEASDAYVRTHGPLATGAVALTESGSLPCRAVIHAVGPVWHRGDVEPDQLRQAVRSSLELADREGYRSLAMPAISSGIFGFPKPLCAEILIDTALAFAVAHPDTPLREIRFTNFDQPTVEVFVAAFEQRFGESLERG